MMRDDETRLNAAIEALQSAHADGDQVTAAASRVAERLGMEAGGVMRIEAIENCDDVQRLFRAYRAGILPAPRALVIEAHMRDCGACLRQFKTGSTTLDWSRPEAARATAWRPRFAWAMRWALVPTLAVLAASFFAYKMYWQVPPGVRAEVESIDGFAYRISSAGDRQLAPGDKLGEGDHLRTSGGAHAVIRLSDGSKVEVNERSLLGVGAQGRNMTVSLDNGAVIVEAAKRTAGHLYVKTPDCRVAVTGTVFSLDSGIKGSRLAVLEGAVHVTHAGVETVVSAGSQMTTSESLQPAMSAQQIAWSHDLEKYLPLLAQFAILQHKVEQIPFPRSRYSSDLLQRVPESTLLYVSIPNLGDFLSDANQIFHDQLQQSPELQQWWSRGKGRNPVELDAMVDKLHQMSQYIGEEVVIVCMKETDHPGFAIVADVKKSGLDTFLRQQLPISGSTPGLTLFDAASLAAAVDGGKTKEGGYGIVREHEVLFSNSIATLKEVNAQFNAGASGFASGDFGQQIAAAYGRGAGVILAADLHQMLADRALTTHGNDNNAKVLDESGLNGVRYLIAEHRETNGQPENHLNLQFSGARQRVASWLAAPAAMGSLEFVTPNASIAVALLSKDPKAIADDILAMTAAGKIGADHNLREAEQKLHISFRDDLAANLGGDFLLSLDGPVLPTPSWKAVVEVRDPQRLESTLEQLNQSIHDLSHGKDAHNIVISPSDVDGQRYYAITDTTAGSTFAEYTFDDGYMIIAANRPLLMEAIQAHVSGDSLARSAAFKATLPKDDHDNYSAIAYQNLSPVLTPLLSQLSGESAKALQQLASDARPTTICAWGKDNRIEMASDSHLFGFDFFTLGALINPDKSKSKILQKSGLS